MIQHAKKVLGAVWVVALASCASGKETPPLFNAVDPSIQCEAGKIGWDFSTGGSFSQDIRNSRLSSEIRIVEASNCETAPGNLTETLSTSCNGKSACTFNAETIGGSARCGPVVMKYSCGVESKIYTRSFSKADSTVRCGDQITVAQASYGKNCKATNAGNFTTRFIAECSGLRRCSPAKTGNELFGSDPAPGCSKETEVTYFCGSDPTALTFKSAEGGAIDFECPVGRVPSTSSNTVTIRSATYGANCGAPANNWKAKFSSVCDGKTNCSRRVFSTGDNDPKGGCSKEFSLTYTCGVESQVYSLTRPAEAGSNTIDVMCGESMRISSAAFGKNCRDAGVDFTATLGAQCNGARFCTWPNKPSESVFTQASQQNCQDLSWDISYTCGGTSEVLHPTSAGEQGYEWRCPLGPAEPSFESGIRITDATYGGNCGNAAALKNNIYSQATQSCFGKDVCTFTTPTLTSDPSPGCNKAIDITYRCGAEPETFTAHADAASTSTQLSLSCAPAIKVRSATFGAKCGVATGNVTSQATQACNGRKGACNFYVSNLGDPAPNCAKDFQLSYSCGADPTVKTETIAAEATGKTASLSCPMPTTPYSKKACVSVTCMGRQRRNADLECVTDLTLNVIPAPTSWAVQVAHSASGELRQTVTEDTAYDVRVAVDVGTGLPSSIPLGTEVTDAAIWAFDTFENIAKPTSTVKGYRCLIANMALQRPRPNSNTTLPAMGISAILSNRILIGQTTKTVLPPACFGTNIASWRDAAKRMGMTEGDFRAQYRRRDAATIQVSFDPQGRTVALRTQGVAAENALVPNPIGFFYEPPKLWADFLSYYEQTMLPADLLSTTITSNRTPKFDEARDIRLAATKTMLRNPEVEVDIFDPAILPILDVDLTWLKEGDSPARNPFSPVERPLTDFKSLTQLSPKVTIEVTTEEAYNARAAGTPWVSIDNMEQVRTEAPLVNGVAGGSTQRARAYFTPTLRDRLLLLAATTNNGWMRTPTEELRKLKLRACIDLLGFTRSGSDNDATPMSVTRGSTTYTLGFTRGKRCVVADQVLVVKRQLEVRPFAKPKDGAVSAAGESIDQGDATVSTANDIGSQSSCKTACTVSADCGTGQTCDNGGVAGRVGFCSGTGAGKTCQSADHNNMGSGGPLGQSLLNSTTTTANENGDTSATSTVSNDTEALSYRVLNSEDEEEKPWSTVATKFSMTLSPDWDIIIAALKGASIAVEASPFKALFEEKSIRPDIQGLGVGVGATFFLWIGPVILNVEVSAGVGIGLSLTIESESDADVDYPCTGTTKCFKSFPTLSSMREAYDSCIEMGGRLAEVPTSAEYAAVKATIGTDTSNFWLGAQLGYLYPQSSCSTNPSSCLGSTATRYRWISSSKLFAEQYGTNPALLNSVALSPNWGGAASSLLDLRTQMPKGAGVVYNKSSDRLYSLVVDKAVTAKYVCEFEPEFKGSSRKWSVGGKLGVSAGASLAVCMPSAKAGLCISASFSFISFALGITKSHSETSLFNSAGKLVRTRGHDQLKFGWEAAALSGALTAELRLIFFSIGWDIVSFAGVKTWEGTIHSHDDSIWKDYP